MHRTPINPSPCVRCGSKLELRTTVESREGGSAVHFFQCAGCGHIDTDAHENHERSAGG